MSAEGKPRAKVPGGAWGGSMKLYRASRPLFLGTGAVRADVTCSIVIDILPDGSNKSPSEWGVGVDVAVGDRVLDVDHLPHLISQSHVADMVGFHKTAALADPLVSDQVEGYFIVRLTVLDLDHAAPDLNLLKGDRLKSSLCHFLLLLALLGLFIFPSTRHK